MQQKRAQRVVIAIVTAVLSFCLGDFFSSQAQRVSRWAEHPTSDIKCAHMALVRISYVYVLSGKLEGP